MPSGKTHDAITFLLVAPVFAATFAFSKDFALSAVVTSAFLFGGLMFGPDLDTKSCQYSRWSLCKFLWFPYRAVFRHRSRWSHGLVFGTLIRVIYFMGVLTLVSFLAAYIFATYTDGDLPRLMEFAQTWKQIGAFINTNVGEYALPSAFVGLWLGAASHTFTDMAGSFVKTGRITEFL
jgi:uncharacterized metal-binding protein